MILCALLTVAAQSVAQQILVVSPSAEIETRTLRELFNSNDPVKQAWGARLAGDYGRVDFVPDLQSLLRSGDADLEAQSLDALIRLRAKVPLEELMPLWQKWPDEIIILMAVSGQGGSLKPLLNERLRDAQWIAVNQEVAEHGNPGGYAAGLIQDWTIHMKVDVVNQPVGSGEGTSGGICGDSLPTPRRSGLPPPVFNVLHINSQPGSIVLNVHPHPVYYARQLTSSGCDSVTDRDSYRTDLIAMMLNEAPQQMPVKAHMRRSILWKDAKSYTDEMESLRGQSLRGVEEIVQKLLQRNRVTASESAGLKPHFELKINDMRSDQSVPVPSTNPWE